MAAIPNFGSMSVLCTDKTGTLTEDNITLAAWKGVNKTDDETLLRLVYINSYHQSGVKNPLDAAVLNHQTPDISGFNKKGEIPFDYFRKRVSVIVDTPDGSLLICKGAPEEVFSCCKDDDDNRLSIYAQMSREGYRVLAIATKTVTSRSKYTMEDESALMLRGFIAFLDPPKPDAAK
ncbi:hypothetical protein MKQ70_20070 [Chitinophaga sedimenti]|uniref:hypothetical protein n=1 Tax=Chitinophaga sedimenti TaxID=2033606 RepID=UPI002003557C|nr:hypothetical protein [Chitinophaga sedimenti]MCK7557175.1 hypothetical protein [Chitinophaga sedimenti]